MIKLRVDVNDRRILVGAYDHEILVSEYKFESKVDGTELGKSICTTTMINFATLDLLNSKEVLIDYPISTSQFNYLNKQVFFNQIYFKKIIKSYRAPVLKTVGPYAEKSSAAIRTNINEGFLGDTGGKDSTLCRLLTDGEYTEIKSFKINFDDEKFDNEYRIGVQVINDKLYSKFSSKVLIESSNESYYQENDMHSVFAAPYFSVRDNYPRDLIVGIPYDNINIPNLDDLESIEYVVSESYYSILAFVEFVRSLGVKEFSIVSPLARISSFGVYKILLKIYGEEFLKKLDSCWYSFKFEGQPCGTCSKCKRVDIIYSVLFNNKQSILDIKELEFLFGSYTVAKMLKSKEIKQLFEVNTDIYLNYFDSKYSSKFTNKFGLELRLKSD